MTLAVVNEYQRRYGPFAFGLMTIVLLWALVFRPIMTDKDASIRAFSEISATLKEASQSLKDATANQARISEAQAYTARLLDAAVQRLERIADKSDAQNRR